MKPLIALCLLLTGSALYAQDPVAEKLNAVDTSHWYAWTAKNTPEAGAIGMADWLEKPAGKHGRIVRQDDKLVYNGQPIKLWGLNLCFGTCAPEKALADKRAAFYPKFGINTVRLHKFADGAGWSGIQSKDSAAEYDPAGLERMDYQIAKFKAAGIRATGYTGELLGSNWQAGRMFSHYYNLRSDAAGDISDRHNYFGGVLSGFNR
jgi:hypothetical protein